jgi:conjugative relaxase-like TrwC/TraI family protein
VLFALDEVANIAPLEELPQIASEGGGQGLDLLAALQDLSQARARWGQAADGFLTLFATKLILPGIADSRTLEAISTALGEYDRRMVATTTIPSRDAFIPLRGRTESTQRTRVLSPGEIANIPAGRTLHLDGLRWQLLTLTPAHSSEPWKTLTARRAASSSGRDLARRRPGLRGRLRTSSDISTQCVECDPVVGRDVGGGPGGFGVLTVAKVIRGAASGYAEYLEGKAQAAELGDYYLKDGERVEAPGRWASGARIVGQDPGAVVSGRVLRELMAVRRPDTGRPLRRVGGTGEAVAALDATFSAPKSVSAIWAVADPELRAEIECAHEQAIDRALSYSVKRVAMIRHRIAPDTVIHAKPAGLVATSWRHTTARAVGGRAPDPQLHSHVLLHAAVRRDGRVVAIDSRSWLVHRREIGAAYRTELARELNWLGFEIQRGTGRGQRYFELAGVPQELLDRWSSRHHQVQAAIRERLAEQESALRELVAASGAAGSEAGERLALLKRTGQLAPAEERFMSAISRSGKAPVTHTDLDERWQATAGELGLGSDGAGGLRGDRRPLLAAGQSEVLEGLTEFDATFPARDARAVALERSAGAAIADALERLRELRGAEEILVLADGTGTTREHRSRERTTVAIAERLAGGSVPPLAATVVTRETERLQRELADRRGKLSDEQREAIELACGARPLVVIEGHAGTGKSTTLTGIARAHQAAGRQIIVTSTAAIAAERLARELTTASVQTSAYSTAALHAGIANGRIQLAADTTIIHDEAALASTREQQQLLQAVENSGARLIEIGDPRQTQPVGAGGLWPHLERAARRAGAHVELTRNQRARDPADRRDQALFREGEHAQAIRGYAARDRVHIASEQPRAEDQALDAAHADRAAGKTTIVIAQTSNEHLDELNARAQAIRQQHDQLGPETLPLPGRPYALHPGDEVQIRRTIRQPEHGQLRNGTTAQVADVDPDAHTLSLRLADGQKVTVAREQTARADVRLAYVQHPFPAQGQTTDTAHLIIGDHATQAGSYVALTRARQQTHIHAASAAARPSDADRLQALSERMSRTEPELPSIQKPLAHEFAITAELAGASIDAQHNDLTTQLATEARATSASRSREPEIPAPAIPATAASEATADASARDRGAPLPGRDPEISPVPEPDADRTASQMVDEAHDRVWPRSRYGDLAVSDLADDQIEPRRRHGWEP